MRIFSVFKSMCSRLGVCFNIVCHHTRTWPAVTLQLLRGGLAHIQLQLTDLLVQLLQVSLQAHILLSKTRLKNRQHIQKCEWYTLEQRPSLKRFP